MTRLKDTLAKQTDDLFLKTEELKSVIRENKNAYANVSGGAGRDRMEREKFVLCRVLNHDEMSFFTYEPVSRWRV